jgi:hypothetical protein
VQELDARYVKQFYRFTDDRGRYSVGDLTGEGIRTGDSGTPWKNIDPTAKERHWAVPDRGLPDRLLIPKDYFKMSIAERLDILDAQGLIVFRFARDEAYPTPLQAAPVLDLQILCPERRY